MALLSDRDWFADIIHSEANGRDEALYFSPRRVQPEATDGFYILRRGTTVEWGEYDGAFPHIGEADFSKMGESRFADRESARKHINVLIGGHVQLSVGSAR